MAMNRVQFQAGLSMAEAAPVFEVQCRGQDPFGLRASAAGRGRPMRMGCIALAFSGNLGSRGVDCPLKNPVERSTGYCTSEHAT